VRRFCAHREERGGGILCRHAHTLLNKHKLHKLIPRGIHKLQAHHVMQIAHQKSLGDKIRTLGDMFTFAVIAHPIIQFVQKDC